MLNHTYLLFYDMPGMRDEREGECHAVGGGRKEETCHHGLSRRPLRVKLPTKWLSWKLKLMSDKTTLPLKWPNIYPAGRAEYTHNEFM